MMHWERCLLRVYAACMLLSSLAWGSVHAADARSRCVLSWICLAQALVASLLLCMALVAVVMLTRRPTDADDNQSDAFVLFLCAASVLLCIFILLLLSSFWPYVRIS